MKAWLYGTWAVFEKDVRLELRSRYAINTLLVFVLAAALVVAFALGEVPLTPQVQGALLWIVVLFSASLGLGRSFVMEEEGGTVLLLRLHVPGSSVYTGKLLFNFLLMVVVNTVAFGALWLLLNLTVHWPGLLLATLALGALGLAGTTTLLAALIARSANRGAMLPVLLFPLLFPLLLSVVHATHSALLPDEGWNEAANSLVTLVSFAGALITASVLLFEYVWGE